MAAEVVLLLTEEGVAARVKMSSLRLQCLEASRFEASQSSFALVLQVLRRPHEFKIRALEDIRALFPSHWNPFYAGFGNRDTDEISYLTVGIPASKIFIINPKGEYRLPMRVKVSYFLLVTPSSCCRSSPKPSIEEHCGFNDGPLGFSQPPGTYCGRC
jgi:hypothetical protein